MPRTLLAVVTAGLTVASGLVVAGLAEPGAAGAATARPWFKAPYACGETWGASTYPGHGNAIDFNTMRGAETDFGKPVVASAAGRATRGYDSGHGNYVVVDHGRGWSTLYAHLNTVTIRNPILQGEKIGTVGRTGNVTGTHLHYQQRYRGKGVLPLRFDGSRVAYAGSTPGTPRRSTNCATSPVGTMTARALPGRGIRLLGRVLDTDAGPRALSYRIHLRATPGARWSVHALSARTRADGRFAVTVRTTLTGPVPVYLHAYNASGTRGEHRVVKVVRVTVRT